MLDSFFAALLALGFVDWLALISASLGFWYFFLRKPQSAYEFNAAQIKLVTPGNVAATGSFSMADGGGGFVAKMRSTGRQVVVFYGSQTGTAEDLANRLAKDAQRYGLQKGFALDPEECDVEELVRLSEIEKSLVIFCVATYGEGDPTDNAQELHEFLQRGGVDLTGVNYAVFGLGNKTYENFNAMGKFADRRLEELGATRICDLGLGDDDSNLEEDFMLWRDTFWPAVCERFQIKTIGEDICTRQYKLVDFDKDETEALLRDGKVFTGEMARLKSYQTQKPPYDSKNPFLAKIRTNRELHTGGDRSCRHIEFDMTNSRIRYEAGDHVAVFPSNDLCLVEKFGEILGVDLNTVVTLLNVDEDSSKRHPFCCPCSFRTALTHYVDIVTPPKTNVIKELAEYCTDENEKILLQSMTSTKEESRKKFLEWIVHDHRTVLDILVDLPSCRPPLDHLLELMPRLQARYYSISSSPKHDPLVVSITAVVIRYTSRIGRRVDGVATGYLAHQIPSFDQKPQLNGFVVHNSSNGDDADNANDDNVKEKFEPKVPIFVRKSQLRLPRDPKLPVVMIGPGTGLAPFRGFLQDRAALKRSNIPLGRTALYFGCRNRADDFIYREELEQWLEDDVITELHVAPSRENKTGPKTYVQHLLRKNAQSTWRMISEGGHFYVCGDAKNMARDVMDALVDIVAGQGSMTREKAQEYVKRMESQKRYQADVWS